MKRIILLLYLVLAVNVGAFSVDKVKVGDLYYKLYPETKIAKVVPENGGNEGANYADFTKIVIPPYIIHNGARYEVKELRPSAFHHCKRLTTIDIPYSVNVIGQNAFEGCVSLTKIDIPEGVKKIGNGMFRDCKSLKSLKLPSSVTSIGEGAFEKCSNLTSFIIPDNVTKIGARAFAECGSLSSINIPEGVICIEDETFYNCSLLTSVTISGELQTIGNKAFFWCENLSDITLPSSVKSVGTRAFWMCFNVQSVVASAHVFVRLPRAYSGAYTIPEGIEDIADWAFGDCTKIEAIAIPNSVTKIGACAFANCSRLASVTIPNSVKTIGNNAFQQCKSLKSIVIPNSILAIGPNCFIGCDALCEIHYPDGLDLSNACAPSNAKLIVNEISYPPLLTIVDGSLSFDDVTKNNCIDANEQCVIRFKIKNEGKGKANNCTALVSMYGTTEGIVPTIVKLPTIESGKSCDVNIPIKANTNTLNGSVVFSVKVQEPQGWGISPFDITIATKAFEAPFVQIVDYSISSASGKIHKMEPFTLTFNVQNTKYGDAENINIKLNLPANIFIMDGNANLSIPLLKSGEAKKIDVILIANNSYPTTDIPVSIDVQEKYGKYAENKQLNIALNQVASSTITIAAKEVEQERKEIKLATIGSAVDKNIPISQQQNKTTFAVIIANENYQQVAKVPFALNDGNIFKQYCEKTLGLPSQNIHFVGDATINNIKQQVNWLSQVMNAYNGNARVIFYYAGHGVPDEKSKTAFLLPVDGNGSDITTGYKLDDLYSILGSMPSQSVTIFLDACFSGSKREEGMLASARGVAIKVNKGQPTGNMVVFSAATGDETAYPNSQEGHGMFTYYLLKKIQETKGDVTYDELGNYIKQNVSQQSIVLNGKSQTPTVIVSPTVTNWQDWKLK